MFFIPLSKEMENCQIRKTTRGIRLVDGKGYTYTKDRHVGNKSYWRCDYRPWKCKARASLVGCLSGSYTKANIMFNLMTHGHAPTLKRKIMDDNDIDDSACVEPSLPKSLLKPQTKTPPKASPPIPNPPPSPESEMCLRWNSHHFNMQTVFPTLMDSERYVDVTLAAEGQLLKCHKLILSSCSNFFDEMLKNTNASQQTIIFLKDIQFWQIKALVDFMYKGEVNVDQSKLESLLRAAEDLQIKGLAGKSPKKEPDIVTPAIIPETIINESIMERDMKSESPALTEDDGDEEYFPHPEYRKKLQGKKNRKRKISAPPDPSLLKHVKINLKGTKTRPNIKQPKFYSPDYPEYDPDRCVSPPKDTEQLFHIDNIKLEPIEMDIPENPHFFEMNSMMDKSLSEKNSTPEKQKTTNSIVKEPRVYSRISKGVKTTPDNKDTEERNKISVEKQIIFESASKAIEILPSTSKDYNSESSEQLNSDKTVLPTKIIPEQSNKDILSINKKAIIVKCQNIKQIMDDSTSIQQILDVASTTQTLSESDKSKLPQIRVRNLPTTETMLKKFATTQLTSILKKGDSQQIILRKVPTKPSILRHSTPAKKPELSEKDNKEIAEKISLLAKTKKELTSAEDEETETDQIISEDQVKETPEQENISKKDDVDEETDVIPD